MSLCELEIVDTDKVLLFDTPRQGLKVACFGDKSGVVLDTLFDRGCWGCLGVQPHGVFEMVKDKPWALEAPGLILGRQPGFAPGV